MVILVSGCVSMTIVEGGKSVNPVGKTYYTKVNIWYKNPSKIPTANWHIGNTLTVGSRVTIESYGNKRIKFRDSNKTEFTLINASRYSVISLEETFRRYFSKEDVLSTKGTLSKFSNVEQSNILMGVITNGMSKAAVLMAYGYPPSHKTPSLDSDTWYYWESKRIKVTVNFSNDKVVEIRRTADGPFANVNNRDMILMGVVAGMQSYQSRPVYQQPDYYPTYGQQIFKPMPQQSIRYQPQVIQPVYDVAPTMSAVNRQNSYYNSPSFGSPSGQFNPINPSSQYTSPAGRFNPNNPASEYTSPSGMLNPNNPASAVSSPAGMLNPRNPASAVSSPAGMLNPRNPASAVSSPSGIWNPNNPSGQGIHPYYYQQYYLNDD